MFVFVRKLWSSKLGGLMLQPLADPSGLVCVDGMEGMVPADQGQGKALYVGNLHPSVDEHVLQQIFGAIGVVSEVKVIKDKVSNKSAGYGFVKFLDPRSAEQAMSQINRRVLFNQVLTLRLAPQQRLHSGAAQQAEAEGSYVGVAIARPLRRRRSWAPWLLTTPTKIKQNFFMRARVRSLHAALTGAWEGYQWDHHTLASQPHTVLCWLLDGCLSPWQDMRTYAAGSGDCFPQETLMAALPLMTQAGAEY